jgi:hypothetical protein
MKRTLLSNLTIALAIIALTFAHLAFDSLTSLALNLVFGESAASSLKAVKAKVPSLFDAVCPTARAQERQDTEFSEREEMRQTYNIAPGAEVKVSGINGRVEIETSSGGAAEVYILRSARNREDLAYHKVLIEQTPTSLTVHGESNRDNSFNHHEVRQYVRLRVPRQVELSVSGINGRVQVGEIDGAVQLKGINGGVEVAQAVGYADISGINGRVNVTLARLGERGMRLSGINGGIELRFANELNADLRVSGINGDVVTDVPNVTVEGRINRNNFNARIGAGGAPINVSGINGKLHLVAAR